MSNPPVASAAYGGQAIPPLAPLAAPFSATIGGVPAQPFQGFMQWMATSPDFFKLYMRFLADSAELWRAHMEREAGRTAAPAVSLPDDRRFSSPEWGSSPYFDFLRQYYLLYSGFVNASVDAASLSEHEKGQLR